MDSDTQELKGCPHCGALPVDKPADLAVTDDTKVVYHETRCYRREPAFEILYSDDFDLWNRRAFPSENDKKLLHEISDYFDNYYDGAPDASQTQLAMGEFMDPLRELLERIK